MTDQTPDIALIHDGGIGIEQIALPLASCFTVEIVTLEDYVAEGSVDADLYVFFITPRPGRMYEQLKTAIVACDGAKIVIFPTYNKDAMSKIDHLDIDEHVILPVEPQKLRALAKQTINRRVERAWSSLAPAKNKAFTTSLKCFETCFSLLQNGQPLPLAEIETSCRHIREAAALGGLNDWIDALDRHHSYSFRHSMFVCGSLTFFAHAIGIRGADLELLTVGGLLHDIGKSSVATEILDKPGKLDDREWQIIKKHPVYSEEILLREQNLDKIVLSMAVAHHEKLDGTGYPVGLSGSKIDDYVRMTAIADVYSALIDKRAYKGSMSSADALALMETFQGHLDMELLSAFKGFVLDKDREKSVLPKQYVG